MAPAMTCRLRRGISFCEVSGRFIFLDVDRDRYFCLGNEAEGAFRRLVRGLSSPADDPALASLVEKGMLVRSAQGERPRPCPLPSAASQSLLDEARVARPLGIASALAGLLAASLRLKWLGLSRVLEEIRDAKGVVDRPPDRPDALEATAACFQQAVILASLPDKCLQRSVALATRLLSRNVEVELIFGVRLGPFQAHCWVQQGTTLLNDRLDVVRTFTPILVL